VVRQLPGVFPIATYGDHLAWCADLCQTLHVTNVVTGDEVEVSTPPGTYGFEPYTGVFSPDGRVIAVTVHTDARPTTRELQLVLVDAGAGTTTLVQGTAVEGDVFVDWSPSGESVFISSGVAKRSIIEYQVSADTTRRLPVEVGAFYGMAAA
jgi:Tol biopolymer transport system component